MFCHLLLECAFYFITILENCSSHHILKREGLLAKTRKHCISHYEKGVERMRIKEVRNKAKGSTCTVKTFPMNHIFVNIVLTVNSVKNQHYFCLNMQLHYNYDCIIRHSLSGRLVLGVHVDSFLLWTLVGLSGVGEVGPILWKFWRSGRASIASWARQHLRTSNEIWLAIL